ncbi:MAG: helix-turn-helix transcriptional regulator [Clostridiales bacterium]|nr:helix-turn-helix transcriptional regulator [Clostridiales bacterium]
MYDADKQTENIAKSLRWICEIKGISISRLSGMTGISKSTLSSIMRGESSPFLYTAFKICDALDISLMELVGDEPGGGVSDRIWQRRKNGCCTCTVIYLRRKENGSRKPFQCWRRRNEQFLQDHYATASQTFLNF